MSVGTEQVAWHTLDGDETERLLGTGAEGLDPAEARARLARHGPNRLTTPEPVSAISILLAQFASLVVLLLIAAATVTLLFGDILEAVAIGTVLAINTLIGFVVELRARRAMDALLAYEVPVAKVVRGGQVAEIASDQLVPGDVIELDEGDRVPADARLLSAAELRTNEAPLTGESLPVAKDAGRRADLDAPLAERSCMVYSGTAVYVGRATAVVVATGSGTEIGRIGTLVAQVEEGKTPLEVRLDELGRRLVWLTLGVAGVVTGLGLLQGAPVGRMIETGIALAIAAVPEGLPAVATIALAVGLHRMARRQAMVRRLASVEALGATTVVCTDKTGTLTAGAMTATIVVGSGGAIDVTGVGYRSGGELVSPSGPIRENGAWLRRLLEAAALTSRAKVDASAGTMMGDPTDAALTVLALKGGMSAPELLRAKPRVDEVPFSSARRSSASIHEVDG
jgi:Ca2+-transporting ATPase